ncbi:MAG: FAD-binding protein, partial [Armatimonadota bacterium]
MTDKTSPERITCDFLVIGTGIAGLTFALKAADHGEVVVVTKKNDTESNTNYAQGGIAAVMGSDDSFELHEEDTMRAGVYLCNREAVRILVREGPDRVRELMEMGVRFT